jgi:predicted nucleotidyltransferase
MTNTLTFISMSDFQHILSVASRNLADSGIDCLLIGGFAVNYYGYTRNTLDVDFMIVADQVDTIRKTMVEAGFSNVSIHENVVSFSSGENKPRADFLQVSADTMKKLLTNAVEVQIHGYKLSIPSLKDLLAMKVFSLSQNLNQRMGKDLPDIAYLTVINDLDVKADIQPLCNRFGTQEIYELICRQIEGLTHE